MIFTSVCCHIYGTTIDISRSNQLEQNFQKPHIDSPKPQCSHFQLTGWEAVQCQERSHQWTWGSTKLLQSCNNCTHQSGMSHPTYFYVCKTQSKTMVQTYSSRFSGWSTERKKKKVYILLCLEAMPWVFSIEDHWLSWYIKNIMHNH